MHSGIFYLHEAYKRDGRRKPGSARAYPMTSHKLVLDNKQGFPDNDMSNSLRAVETQKQDIHYTHLT